MLSGGVVTSIEFLLWIYYVSHMYVLVAKLGTW